VISIHPKKASHDERPLIILRPKKASLASTFWPISHLYIAAGYLALKALLQSKQRRVDSILNAHLNKMTTAPQQALFKWLACKRT